LGKTKEKQELASLALFFFPPKLCYNPNMKIKKVKISLAVFFGLLLVSFAMFSYAQENSNSNQNIFSDPEQNNLIRSEDLALATTPDTTDLTTDQTLTTADSATPSATTTQTPASTDDQNMTQQLSTQLSDLIQTKSADNQNISMDDLDNLINQLTSSSDLKFEDLPTIDPKVIKIKKQDYSNLSASDQQAKEKADAEQYVTAVSYVFLNNSPTKISNMDDLTKFSQDLLSQVSSLSDDSFSNISYFENMADKGPDILKQLEDIQVPEDLVDVQTQGLQLVTYATSLKGKYKVDSSDPVSSIMALSEVENLMSLAKQYVDNSSQKLNALGVSALPLNLQ
jgi:hypothetical protein